MKTGTLLSRLSLVALLGTQTTTFSMSSDDFGMFDDPDIQGFVADHDWQNTRANDITPGDIVPLINDVGGVALLKQPLYLATNPLNTRDISRSALFVLHNPYRCEYPSSLGGTLFYNQTNELYYTKDKTCIGAYLGIAEPDFIDAVNDIIKKYAGGTTIDGSLANLRIEDIFPLLANAKIQERKVGFMFNAEHSWKRMRLHAHMPFYWFERNYFFNKQEQQALEARFGATSQSEQDSFAEQHLISDKLGFGDARFQIGIQVHSTPCSDITAGGIITLPTALTVKKGLLGIVHKPVEVRPEFNLEKYFELFQGDDKNPKAIVDNLTALGLGAIDQLSANILETPLGNKGHIGLGGFVQTEMALDRFIKRPWATCIVMRSNIGLEYMLPGNETRFFVQTDEAINEAFAGRDFSSDDVAIATDNLKFLQTELINRLYPFTFDTTVNPGLFIRWTSSMNYDKPCWGIRIGSDFWYRTKESFGSIKAPQELLPTLDIEKAIRPRAYQSKLHLTTYWKVQRSTHDVIFSLMADGSYFGAGVGNDVTFGFKVESNF